MVRSTRRLCRCQEPQQRRIRVPSTLDALYSTLGVEPGHVLLTRHARYDTMCLDGWNRGEFYAASVCVWLRSGLVGLGWLRLVGFHRNT